MVLVMDWTATWAPPPIATSPTIIWRLVIGRSCSAASVISLPRSYTKLIRSLYESGLLRDERPSREDFTQIGVRCEQEQHQHQRETEGCHLADRLLPDRPAQDLLRSYEEEMPPVERQDRQQVE